MGAAIGTTPTITLTHHVSGLDWTSVQNMYMTFRSGSKKVTKTGADLVVTADSVGAFLKQEETLLFGSTVYIQANWTYPGGLRGSTKVVSYTMDDQLEKEVLE